MPAPVIDPQSSIPFMPQWQPWEHIFSASNAPTSWAVNSGGIPTGMEFEPVILAIGEESTDAITAAGHKFTNGVQVIFRDLTGGSGLSTGTLYYVRDKSGDTFKLSATSGGAAINFTTDITEGYFYRPGQLTGAAELPGIYKMRLVASGDGDSAEVLYVIGIYPSAPTLDANRDLVWDLDDGSVQRQQYSTLPPASGTAAGTDAIFVIKEGDDMMSRIRQRKGGAVIDLPSISLRLVLKEFEPEVEVVVSTAWVKEGEGANASHLLHAKFDGAALTAALSNYEADQGTGYDGLAELEMVYSNPESIGPPELTISSKTFRIRIERDIADNEE